MVSVVLSHQGIWWVTFISAKMKSGIFLLITIFITLTSCEQKKRLPDGVMLQKTRGGDYILVLEKDAALPIRQENNGILLSITNINGVLQTLQISDGGTTPVGVDYLSDDTAKIIIDRSKHGKRLFVFDDNGDGIPDTKIDFKKEGKPTKYKLRKIEWEEIIPQK